MKTPWPPGCRLDLLTAPDTNILSWVKSISQDHISTRIPAEYAWADDVLLVTKGAHVMRGPAGWARRAGQVCGDDPVVGT